jgi:hypothetical protein
MKFLCLKCDEAMSLKKVEEDSEKSVGLTFHCKKCGSSFAMLTNPMETQLVKSLGVAIGGKTLPHSPMEMIGSSLAGNDGGEEEGGELKWEPEADERLQNVPAMARSMARAAIEKRAREKGVEVITTAFMDEVKKEIH